MPASRAPRATPTTGERPQPLGDLRGTLLEEGWAATIESGGKDISLREIARRAGVSPTASFHHFRNKEALLVAVAVEGFARLTATLRKRVESIDDPTERLRIVLRTYIEFAIEHPAVFFRMFGPLLSRDAFRCCEGPSSLWSSVHHTSWRGGFARLTATLRKCVESIDDPTERLRIVLRTYIEFAIEHPAVFFRMFGPLLQGTIAER